MATLLTAVGFVLVFEGLVFALAPSRLDDLVEMLRSIPIDKRRGIGLTAVALGVLLLWVARSALG